MLLLWTGRTHPRVLQGWTVLHSRREIKQHINEHLLTKRTESDSGSKAWSPCSPREAQAGRGRLRKYELRPRLRGQGGQCAHSQCIPTGFYKAYKIISEGIRFLEICYSVPFNGKEKNQQQMMTDQAPSQLGGTNTTWSAMLTFWTPELEQKMLSWDGERERHKY